MKYKCIRLLELATICCIGADGVSDTDPPPAADGGGVPPPGGVIDVAPPIEREPELASEPQRGEPPPELIDAVVRYFNTQRATLLNKVADIETLLGFIADDADDKSLAVRVARLEAFCGLKA